MIWSAVSAEPTTMATALDLLALKTRESGIDIDKVGAAEVFEALIRTNAPVRNASEVAWAIWGAIALEVDLSDAAATAVAGMEDDFVALLALHADQFAGSRPVRSTRPSGKRSSTMTRSSTGLTGCSRTRRVGGGGCRPPFPGSRRTPSSRCWTRTTSVLRRRSTAKPVHRTSWTAPRRAGTGRVHVDREAGSSPSGGDPEPSPASPPRTGSRFKPI